MFSGSSVSLGLSEGSLYMLIVIMSHMDCGYFQIMALSVQNRSLEVIGGKMLMGHVTVHIIIVMNSEGNKRTCMKKNFIVAFNRNLGAVLL